MSKENRQMPARGGEVGFHYPDEKVAPRGTKLLIVNAGGCLIVSDWQDGCGHLQWSHPPKARKREDEIAAAKLAALAEPVPVKSWFQRLVDWLTFFGERICR